ncbi:MAG: hypothetical protein HY763_05370 [Planctomycetes bacterium]|nr:hypothetical protein [Planctomycetota bacterium]
MRIFTGQYDRSFDGKNRIQLPSQLRAKIDAKHDGAGVYVTLGEHRGTLSLFTERAFEEIAARIETEFIPGAESRAFELQFYGLASHVDLDKQGRILIPDRLRKKAGLKDEIYLVGQKYRIDLWNRVDFDRCLGIDWEGDEWPEQWASFLRMRPARPPSG